MSSLAFTAGAWIWDKYGEAVTNKAAGAVKSRWNKFKWGNASDAYRAKIKKLYGTMQIMGMAEPVPLDDIFTDVYMLNKPTAFGRFDTERLKKISADPDALSSNVKRINGLKLVIEKGNLFILGKPGSGKTTFLKYIALKAAEQTIDKVPIFVSLKEWSDSGLELLPFIEEWFDICDFPVAQPFIEELLRSGSAIVLFDGFDEVNQADGQRDKQTHAMNKFIKKYVQTQFLITCRTATSDYSFQPFSYVEIADFTEKQIQRFVGNWFRDDKETRDKFLVEFARDDNKGLRDLARSPLLLTLLCLTFRETLTFPQRWVEIYREALDELLKQWDLSRGIKRDDFYNKFSLPTEDHELRNKPIISILFLSADPTDASRLRLGEELREIREKLHLAKLREQFDLQLRMSVRPVDVSQALLDVNPQIVHFSGHGTYAGALCLENQVGEVHPVQPSAIAALFEQFADQLDCVVLNACYSNIQAIAIAQHIKYVIGMNQAIGDKAAIAFAVGFYQALGVGRTIETAYKLGCAQIRMQNISEHLTPVLIKREEIHSY